ncbi:hypothetical protein Tco_0617457 [Tanacetum coccineum]
MSVLQVLSSKPLISCQQMRFKRIAKVANAPCEVGLRGGVTKSDVLSSGIVVEVRGRKRDAAYQRQVFTRKRVYTIPNTAYPPSAIAVKMDNPNISMEEYIRLEEEKARKLGKCSTGKLLSMVISGMMKMFTISDPLKPNS